MSTESRPSNKEINETTERKVSVWRTFRNEVRELPRLRDRAERNRNIATAASGVFASYFGYVLANAEAIATDSLAGLFMLGAVGVGVLNENARRGRERQIAEAPRQEAAYAREVVAHAERYGLSIRGGEPGDLRFQLEESIAKGVPQQPAAPAPESGPTA